MKELFIRFVIGGAVVSVFALLGIYFARRALLAHSELHHRLHWQPSA
jgi:hypothetical protein